MRSIHSLIFVHSCLLSTYDVEGRHWSRCWTCCREYDQDPILLEVTLLPLTINRNICIYVGVCVHAHTCICACCCFKPLSFGVHFHLLCTVETNPIIQVAVEKADCRRLKAGAGTLILATQGVVLGPVVSSSRGSWWERQNLGPTPRPPESESVSSQDSQVSLSW